LTKERVDSLNELGFDWKGSSTFADVATKSLDKEREEKTERMDETETFV